MRAVLRWPGYAIRFLAIAVVILGLGSLYGLLRLVSLFIWDRERRRGFVARTRGRLCRWAMTALGATFIKLGQVMSTRPDLFQPEVVDELRRMQDQVPPFSFRRVKKTVEAELGMPLDEVYDEFDREPVAAASVAQVHRAHLPSGDEVAVKVLRPWVRQIVERDGAILGVLARLVALSPRARLNDPVAHLEEFISGILDQTDLRKEAANYQAFEANFDGFDGVRFPAVYPELTGERVLTMEFIRGRKIDALGDGDHSGLGAIARTMFMKMCFEDGLVHADLHPGNLLVTGEAELVVFDVGLVKKLPDDTLEQFVDFSRCVSMGTSADFVAHFRRFHTYMEDVDWAEIERDCDQFVAKYRALDVTTLELGAFVNELFGLARKHRVRPLPELALVIVGTVTSEGIAKMINPDSNTFEEMARFLAPILERRNAAG